MKKILILIVCITVFLHFKPQPELDQWYENKKTEFLQMMAQSTKVTTKANTNKLYEELKTQFIGFSDAEKEKLKDISASVDNITSFYNNHCTEGKPLSGMFHPDNEDKVCRKVTSFIKGL